MIYDDFHAETRISLVYWVVFFIKRIFYALILAFLSDVRLTSTNLYIFVVTIIPMLFFSYTLPFKYVGLNALMCIDEFSEFLVGVVFMHYKEPWISDDEFFGYARFLIAYITVWILLHLLFMLVHLFFSIFDVCCKAWTFKDVSKLLVMSVSPNSKRSSS